MGLLDALLQDLRYGLRMLRKSPGFTAVAMLSLAAGIGLTTALFTLVDAWLVRPLPFRDADRLVIMLRSKLETPDEPAVFPLFHDYVHWRRESRSFEQLAGAFWRSYLIDPQRGATNGEPEQLDGMIATTNLFDTLGVHALVGRTFAAADEHGPSVAILGDAFWRKRFGGSPSILGTTVALNGKPFHIIGVAPAGLGLRLLNQPFDPQVYTLLQPGEPLYGPDDVGPMAGIGRLRAGVDLAAARAELNAIQKRVDALYPKLNLQTFGVHVAQLQEDNTRTVRASLTVLVSAAAFLLLVVCANVASLLLGRAAARQREMAVRTALGSTRARLVRQLLTESTLLSIGAVALGVGLAQLAVRAFVAVNPFDLLPQNQVAIDARVLLFAVAVTVITTVLFGLAPARHVARVDVQHVLKDVGRGAGAAGSSTQRWRNLLVMAEMAVCTILLTGAALMLATLDRLYAEPLGVRPEGVTVIELSLPKDLHASGTRLNGFYDTLLERLRAQPGVESAAIAGGPIYVGTNTTFSVEGTPDPSADRAFGTTLDRVTSEYFATVGITLRKGRLFTSADVSTSEPVVIVNEAVVRQRFHGENPVGRRIRIGDVPTWCTIVGVVGSTRSRFYNTLALRTEPRLYLLSAQRPDTAATAESYRAWVYVRGRSPEARAIRDVVWAIDPRVPIGKIRSYADVVTEELRQPRTRSAMIAAFALFALGLAITGLYAVTSQWVALRGHELGVRVALGARARDLVALVVRQGLTLVIVGTAIGLGGAIALARVLRSLLYGVSAADPIVLTSVAGVLLASAALGCYLPARRAARIDPLAALRHE